MVFKSLGQWEVVGAHGENPDTGPGRSWGSDPELSCCAPRCHQTITGPRLQIFERQFHATHGGVLLLVTEALWVVTFNLGGLVWQRVRGVRLLWGAGEGDEGRQGQRTSAGRPWSCLQSVGHDNRQTRPWRDTKNTITKDQS